MKEITTLTSAHNFDEICHRVQEAIADHSFKIFARISHGREAVEQGLELRPTELFIFGNPQVGTYLMQDQQSCGIDLPVKILVWEDQYGKAKLTYNHVESLKEKHHLLPKSHAIINKISGVIKGICEKAAGN